MLCIAQCNFPICNAKDLFKIWNRFCIWRLRTLKIECLSSKIKFSKMHLRSISIGRHWLFIPSNFSILWNKKGRGKLKFYFPRRSNRVSCPQLLGLYNKNEQELNSKNSTHFIPWQHNYTLVHPKIQFIRIVQPKIYGKLWNVRSFLQPFPLSFLLTL